MINGGRLRGIAALAEVALAFGIMHLSFRAFRQGTAPGRLETEGGWNFSPGIVMTLVAVAFIAARRRAPAAYGLTARPAAPGIHGALWCLLILAALGALAVAAGAPLERPPVSAAGALTPAAVGIAGTLIVLWSLGKVGVERLAGWAGLAVLACIALVPLVLSLASGRRLADPALTVLWVLGCAGAGEEIFFRGYVQSRLNDAFGRPFRLFGVDFGVGLFGAAALFGLVHVLNGVDYFAGEYRPMWWHGLAAGSTVFYGFLRERYGSVLAPAIVHGWGNLLMRIPGMVQPPG
jgi:membrane protease YdiL (CAAX protease family)